MLPNIITIQVTMTTNFLITISLKQIDERNANPTVSSRKCLNGLGFSIQKNRFGIIKIANI